jgi:hypothetical protein
MSEVLAWVAVPVDRCDFAMPPCVPSQRAELLVVSPQSRSLSEGALLRIKSGYRVNEAINQSDVFALRLGKVHLAVLSTALGPIVLRAVAESIRRQWPSARILIVGGAQSVLDDHLYDDAISHQCALEELLTALLDLSADPWNQRPQTFELDPGLARCTEDGMAAFRPIPAESDPTKADPHDLAENEIPRDIPGQEREDRRDDEESRKEAQL